MAGIVRDLDAGTLTQEQLAEILLGPEEAARRAKK
jgi:hypothetical protein